MLYMLEYVKSTFASKRCKGYREIKVQFKPVIISTTNNIKVMQLNEAIIEINVENVRQTTCGLEKASRFGDKGNSPSSVEKPLTLSVM